jgi:hypothetical protein
VCSPAGQIRPIIADDDDDDRKMFFYFNLRILAASLTGREKPKKAD